METTDAGWRAPGAHAPGGLSGHVVGALVLAVAALTALALAGELSGARTPSEPGAATDVAVAVVAVVGAALVLRPGRGVPTGPAAALLLAVLAGVGAVATPASTLATLHLARSAPLPTAVAVAVAGAVGHVVRGVWRPMPGLSFGWWVVLVLVGHAALLAWGVLGRLRDRLVAELCARAEAAERDQERRLAEARNQERTRIAREMHDSLAHRLSLLSAYAGAVEYRPDTDPARLAHAAGVIRDSAHRALDELREVIGVLREPASGEEAAAAPAATPPAPVPDLRAIDALVAESRAVGCDVRLDRRLDAGAEPPAAVARTVYRVVQEGLTNVRRHAPGEQVDVVVAGAPGDGVDVRLANAVPVERVPDAHGSGTGLVGLAERVDLVGGHLEHGTDGQRFVLRAWLPWPA